MSDCHSHTLRGPSCLCRVFMIGEIVPHSMKNLSVGSMGGRVGLGRGQRRVSPPSLGLARYSGLPGQGQEETRWTGSWKGRHTAPVSHAHRHDVCLRAGPCQPICKSLRNNFASRPVRSRSRLKTAATKNSLLYGQWRAVRRAEGGPGAVFPAVKVTPVQPWASRQTGVG